MGYATIPASSCPRPSLYSGPCTSASSSNNARELDLFSSLATIQNLATKFTYDFGICLCLFFITQAHPMHHILPSPPSALFSLVKECNNFCSTHIEEGQNLLFQPLKNDFNLPLPQYFVAFLLVSSVVSAGHINLKEKSSGQGVSFGKWTVIEDFRNFGESFLYDSQMYPCPVLSFSRWEVLHRAPYGRQF